MKRFITYFILLLLLMAACHDGENLRARDEEYFPLQVGSFLVYAVEEIRYTAFNPPESLAYDLKVEIVDSFTNSEGGVTYIQHRSTRMNEEDPWVFNETWSVRRTSQFAIATEGNTSYVKLIFPLQRGSKWNGNLFNGLSVDEYTLQSKGEVFAAGNGLTFSNAAVVTQNNESNLVFKDERIEVYSLGLGLVFKESKVWSYNCSGGICTGQISSGKYLKQVLKEHG